MNQQDEFDKLFDELEFEEKEIPEIEKAEEGLEYNELLDSYNKLKFLYSYFEEINKEFEPEIILNISLDHLHNLMGFDSCMVITRDESEKNTNILLKRNLIEYETKAIDFFVNEGLIEWCTNTFKMSAGYIGDLSLYTILSPLIANNRVVGFFAGFFKEEKDFSQKDMELQNILFNQLAVLIEKLKLYEKLIKNEDTLEIRLNELTMLYDDLKHSFNFIRRIGKLFNIEELYNLIMEVFIPTFEVEKLLILKYEENKFSYLKSTGYEMSEINSANFNDNNSIIKYFMEKSEPVNKFFSDEKYKNIVRVGIESDTMLGSPIMSGDKIFGFILLASRNMNKPFMNNHKNLLKSMLQVVNYSIDIIDYHKEMIEKQRIQRDLKLASDIQKSLLPKSPPRCDKIEFSSFFLPARMVGGDYYDFITRKDGKIIGLIADVSGKGVAASITMATIRSIIRSESLQPNFDIGNVMVRINNMICEDIYQGKFVTVYYFVIKPELNEISMTSAGHNPAIYFDSSDNSLHDILTGGIPIGLRENEAYPYNTMTLKKGDILFFYTDGLNEARNVDDEEFGMDRIHDIIKQNSGLKIDELVNKMSEEWKSFTKGAPQHDDTTFIALKVNDDNKILSISDFTKIIIPSNSNEIKRVVADIENKIKAKGVSHERLFDVNLVLLEILNNAHIHGNEEDEGKIISISYKMNDSFFEAVIEDQGDGFDYEKIIFASQPDKERHRGILFVKALTNEYKYFDNGSKVYFKILLKEEV